VRTLARDDDLAATIFLRVKGRLARALLNLAEYVGEDSGSSRIQFVSRAVKVNYGRRGTRERKPDHERVAQAGYCHTIIPLLLHQRSKSAGAGYGVRKLTGRVIHDQWNCFRFSTESAVYPEVEWSSRAQTARPISELRPTWFQQKRSRATIGYLTRFGDIQRCVSFR
jgi:hypothetical protein